jgi:hypothetical protein
LVLDLDDEDYSDDEVQPPQRPAQRSSQRQPTAVTTHVTPSISSANRNDIIVYLDTGASSNAVSFNSPIIHDVHDIPTREMIGIGQEDCTHAGILQHFGPALIAPSLSIHIVSASVQIKRENELSFYNVLNCFSLSRDGTEYNMLTHRSNGLYGYSYMRSAAHVQLRLDRLINGRFYTPEKQGRAAAG